MNEQTGICFSVAFLLIILDVDMGGVVGIYCGMGIRFEKFDT
jgi:hypothetical protein